MGRIEKNQRKPDNQGRRRKKQRKGNKIGKIIGICVLLFLAAVAAAAVKRVVIPVISMYTEAVRLVGESTEETFKSEQTSIVYDVNGSEIKKLKGEKDVSYLDYEELPDAAKLAIISVEDKNFTTHRGIDMEGIARAVVALFRNKGEITVGGSTITQQLARNIFLNYEKTYSRKIQEIFIAVALEQKYTKQQILEYYLNNVYFSNGYYGIQSAAQAYFDKDAVDLTISQIAFLCAIPNSPTHYDPYEHPESTLARRNKILGTMLEEGFITQEQYDKSVAEEITVLPKKVTQSNDYAETYILKCATEALMKDRGFEFKTKFSTEAEKEAYDEEYDELYSSCKQSLYKAGYRIYTSIDMDMQKKLQTSVSTQLSMFTEKTDDGIYKIQGAAVCIDNTTGRVSAIVGGREEDQEGYGLNRAYQSYRQPGSAIKPLLVYAPALEQGYTPYSTVDDSRMTGEDKVSNSGYTYMGSVSLRKAVQKSSNVATYRLYQELGPERCLEYLENMKFKGLQPEDYKYDTTCLGGFTKGTTPVEMAAGYAALANDGEYREPTCIVKITDSENNIIVPDEQKGKNIYSSNAARMMTDVLESCVTTSSATASGCKLDVDMPAACKTGTTTDYVDGWLCGYTPYYTTAVWVGMDVYKSVDNLKGNTYPAYIWKNYMDKIHQDLERREFSSYLGEEDTTQEPSTDEEDEGEADIGEDGEDTPQVTEPSDLPQDDTESRDDEKQDDGSLPKEDEEENDTGEDQEGKSEEEKPENPPDDGGGQEDAPVEEEPAVGQNGEEE